jgi:predicted small metal-binding protein
MSFVALRRSAWEAATPKQRAVLKLAADKLQIGDPASHTFNGNEWYVSEDSRFDFNDACWLVGLALSATEIQAYEINHAEGNHKPMDTIRAEIKEIIKSNKPQVSEWEDLQAASPNWLRVGTSMDGFTV